MKFIKKWWQLGVIIMLVVIMVVLVLLGLKSINMYKEAIYDQQDSIEQLENFVEDYDGNGVGNMIDCYILSRSVRVGETIQEDDLMPITIPEKIAYTEHDVDVTSTDENGKEVVSTETEKVIDVITSLNDVEGKYYRVDMEKGTVLLSQYIADYKIENSARYREIIVDSFPTDIKAGDYVDINISFGTFEEFVALPYIKIEEVNITNGIFKVIFTDYQESVYNSMLLDKALYDNVTIDMIKYVDASAQSAAQAFYPINTNIIEVMAVNRNLIGLVEEEMLLERQELNKSLGGDLDEKTEDERDASKVVQSIKLVKNQLSSALSSSIRDRIKAEEAAAKEAARNK